ncbi:MAG TPA: non-ribosomal peptide synthetase [Candidatus Binatia bacterium]|nr:non-ribosomal peptide synthetase [Candidatus Binatia bacterium]
MTATPLEEILAAFDDPNASISAIFEKQVARYPQRLAVASGINRLNYDELNQAANRIAQIVQTRLAPDAVSVALLFAPGAAIVAAILGVLKTGRLYAALDPSYPQQRTVHMLEDCEARLLLTDSRHISLAKELAKRGQEIVNCDGITEAPPLANLNHQPSGNTAAFLLYTSGSTGNPKGVLHNHRNVLVEVRNYTADARIGPDDRLAVLHSFSFANSIRNLYGALLNGAAVFPYDLPQQGLLALPNWIRDNNITMIHTLATTFRALIDILPAHTTFPSVRVLRLGGEPINSDDVEKFKRRFPPPCVLMHVMGPTETFSIRRQFIGHDWNGDHGKVPVGYPVQEKEVLILDDSGQPVAAGEAGEIVVRSKYLAVGYWRQPELTRAVFQAAPNGSEERMYFTGDLGVMRSDGCLMHLGRKDFQVKIRGYRVETGEIEAALTKFDSVKAAVVHAQHDQQGEQRLIAYVVRVPGKAARTDELRRGLSETLPDFMMPSNFVFLDDFPLLPNGKINRRALPAPELDRKALERPYTAPRTETESSLVQIWTEVLQLESVGIYDRFLDLGGNSLRAVRILNRARDCFEVELSLSDLMLTETVAQMADLIARLKGSPTNDPC